MPDNREQEPYVRKPIRVPESGGATRTRTVSALVETSRIGEVIAEPETHGRGDRRTDRVTLRKLRSIVEASMPS